MRAALTLDQSVLPVQGPPGAGLVGDGRDGIGIRALHPQAPQVEAVAIGELSEAVAVEAAKEVPLGRPAIPSGRSTSAASLAA